MFFFEKKDAVQNFHKGQTRLSPENNVRNNKIMLRKMYESSELLKCVLRKISNGLVFYPIRNPLIPTST